MFYCVIADHFSKTFLEKQKLLVSATISRNKTRYLWRLANEIHVAMFSLKTLEVDEDVYHIKIGKQE